MKILVYPHDILKQEARPVERIDGKLQNFIDGMFETMYAAKGVGLAANQVGDLRRLVVIDVMGEEKGPEPLVFVNPVILASEGEETEEEGCLSVPGYGAPIKRASRIQVAAFDRNEKEIRLEAEGLLARCLQHEIDHLNGVCFVDRLAPLKRALFRKKWKKMRPEEA